MRLTIKNLFGFAVIFICILIFQDNAHAIFELQVTPRRGGNNIRFEQVQPGVLPQNEEVTVTVQTDEAAQYRILQTVYQPLTNEFGNTIPQGAFIVFSPSSPLGTLRTQLETPVSMGQYPIFTSNGAGDTDSFILVYNARVPENQPGGVYHTQIQFMLELVSPKSGITSRIVNMDVRLEIRPTFRITIKNVQGGRDLNFSRITKDNPTSAEALNIEIQSNIGSTFRIIQQLTEPLMSQDGEMLDPGLIKFVATGANKGALSAAGTPVELSQAPQPFYTSNKVGEGDVLQLQYVIAPPADQKAGVYAGSISFRVESSSFSAPAETFNIPVKIEIEPTFYLDVKAEDGSGIHFGTFRTGDENQQKRVTLTVYSNMGKPYQVTQIIPRKLTNAEGKAIPESYFMYFGAEAQTGKLQAKVPTPVQEGESVVFTSDNKGTPDKFILNYTLTIPKGTRAGSYSSEVRYSITTL